MAGSYEASTTSGRRCGRPASRPVDTTHGSAHRLSQNALSTCGMSLLDGRPSWDRRPRQRWVDQLVDVMIEIHAVHVPTGTTLPAIDRYEQAVYQPPRWTSQSNMWGRAFEIFHGPNPTSDVGFVHRDFHPGNTLWHRQRLTGVIDWQAGCVGPASIDPAHCRINLLDRPELADQLMKT
ncbi:MAG: aminoglycoside phosphotransferase family protein, partial [Ilumatobacteraceae bacterium]